MLAWIKNLFKKPESRPSNNFTFGNMVSTKKIYFSEDLSEIYGTDEMHCGEYIDSLEDHKINTYCRITKLAYIWRQMEAFSGGRGSLYINGVCYKSHPETCDSIEAIVLEFLKNATVDEREIYHARLAWFRTNWSW